LSSKADSIRTGAYHFIRPGALHRLLAAIPGHLRPSGSSVLGR
jgi:hypothetical protein